ncbi:S8 family peptidase [Deinococcus aerophilus]|uniref:Peptidase S8/S53 domain-containing protein n=1 Tax=Deinococcus aerophilus TaxID=522488 RepID=A0ABQ2GX63_9DEIO|nr:S8 family serine peptidase [Deinococcus aerophilus]GGM15200.1 hypothetical protein GCM10010841_24610 [Deinococcus aerophilus]
MMPNFLRNLALLTTGLSLLSACGTTAGSDGTRLAPQATINFKIAESVGSRGAWIIGSRGAWIIGQQASTVAGLDNTFPENMGAWQQIRLPQAHAKTPSMGSGVLVAVIDTGIDLDHPAFEGKLIGSGAWRDWVDGDRIPDDEGNYNDPSLVGYGHGTNVASILTQVAPKVKILPLRVLSSNGTGTIADIVAAIDYAITQKVQIINMSVGTDVSTDVDLAVKRATAKGIYVVASSGNTGDRRVTAPARYATLSDTSAALSLSVGSVNRHDIRSEFSTYGPKLELLAPGEGMMGAAPEGMTEAWSGTSMTAPIASGVIALALGELPPGQRAKWINKVANQLALTADPVDAVNAPDLIGHLGKGRINAERFINSVLP